MQNRILLTYLLVIQIDIEIFVRESLSFARNESEPPLGQCNNANIPKTLKNKQTNIVTEKLTEKRQKQYSIDFDTNLLALSDSGASL